MQFVINLCSASTLGVWLEPSFLDIDCHIKILHSKISRLLVYASYCYLIIAEARKAGQIT